MRTGRNIVLTSILQCAFLHAERSERPASYSWHFLTFLDISWHVPPLYAALSLSDQDPYIPQPPAQVLEKLPPQPLTSEQRTAKLARFAGSTKIGKSRENLQENPIFRGKIDGFRLRFSLENQSIDWRIFWISICIILQSANVCNIWCQDENQRTDVVS